MRGCPIGRYQRIEIKRANVSSRREDDDFRAECQKVAIVSLLVKDKERFLLSYQTEDY